mmetsp:Transcript_7488/g.9057  ORF Transcript_7488/g.9057 Transcript_7488/m.9057 type:complete len:93 (+) Transcript_7488:1845-2123(+)
MISHAVSCDLSGVASVATTHGKGVGIEVLLRICHGFLDALRVNTARLGLVHIYRFCIVQEHWQLHGVNIFYEDGASLRLALRRHLLGFGGIS